MIKKRKNEKEREKGWKKEVQKKRPRLTRGERGKSYLNDIVAGVHARRLALIAPLGRPCYPYSRVGRGKQTLPSRQFRTCVPGHVNVRVSLSLSLSVYIQKRVIKRAHIGETRRGVWKRIAQRTKKSSDWRRTAIKATRGTFTVYL